MKLKFYDYETYPDWWCCVVSEEEDYYASKPYKFEFTLEEEQKIKDKMRVYTSDGGKESYLALINDLKTNVNAGYNSKRFDQVISKCIASHFTTRQVYIASKILTEKVHEIPKSMEVSNSELARIGAYVGWGSKWAGAQANQDLMDDSDKGLKDKEAAFGMDIRETTVPFDTIDLTDKQKEDIIYYCKHDVYALHVMYACVSKPYVDTKLILGETYNIDTKVCYESTNAVLVGKALGAERVSGTTIKDPTFKIYQQPIREYIEKWVPKDVLDHLYTSQKPKQFSLFENKVYTADGGIHSVYTTPKISKEQSKLYVEACEEYGLFNIDLSGCHPSVMLYVGAMPRGITKPEVFEHSVLERRRLKTIPKSTWSVKEQKTVTSGKLIHNTAFGAAGNKYLPLYDDYMRSKVCRVSQMIIIAVCMEVYFKLKGVKIIQTNTDGILLYMNRAYLPQLKAIIKNFEELSNFAFELEEDAKIWQLNVNNYIAIDIDGSDKLKGKSFVTSIWQPGYNKVRPLGNHIIAKAQYEFYVNKVDPIKFLLEHDHIDDFILTCTKGPTYSNMVQKNRDGDLVLGKVARVAATTVKKYGEVRKLKYVDGKLSEDLVANCPPNTWIMNDALYNYKIVGPMHDRRIEHISGMSAPIDMSYYARLLDKVLNVSWYKFYKGKLQYTTEFNLGGD